MLCTLERYSYGEHETEGVLRVGGREFATIEQPWVPNPNGSEGGKPFASCIPEGMYSMHYFKRPNGNDAYILVNEHLGVFRYADDHEAGKGRHLCLIHAANWVRDVKGCVAPGMKRWPMPTDSSGKPVQAVRHSGEAMNKLVELLGTNENEKHMLTVLNRCGTGERDGW